MKIIYGFALSICLVSAKITQFASLQCGDHQVVNTDQLCIEPNYIQGCQTYSNISSCSECQDGYLLKDSRCNYNSTQSLVKIVGCLNYNQNLQCLSCANGFRRVNGKCQIGIKDCLNYSPNGLCEKCRDEYTLIMNECKHNFLIGCKLEDANHNCKQCYSPFELKGTQCDVEFCQTINDLGCVACECGYYLKSDGSCEKISDGCLRYERGKCRDCMKHYKLKGGVCKIQGCVEYNGQNCKACDQKYEKVDGECKYKNCFEWQDQKCLICKEGFYLKDSQCFELPSDSSICK